MPYKNISDLPAAQVDQYSQHQKKAFLEAFNNAYEEYGGDESRAFAVAHSAAKKAGGAARGPEKSERRERAER
jgi:cation transport regulator